MSFPPSRACLLFLACRSDLFSSEDRSFRKLKIFSQGTDDQGLPIQLPGFDSRSRSAPAPECFTRALQRADPALGFASCRVVGTTRAHSGGHVPARIISLRNPDLPGAYPLLGFRPAEFSEMLGRLDGPGHPCWARFRSNRSGPCRSLQRLGRLMPCRSGRPLPAEDRLPV